MKHKPTSKIDCIDMNCEFCNTDIGTDNPTNPSCCSMAIMDAKMKLRHDDVSRWVKALGKKLDGLINR